MFLSNHSPQDDLIQSVVMPCCPQTSIPLLMACTANVKTVVANPIVYLTNLTHDILQTINALDSPPHPDVVNNEVKTISLYRILLLVIAWNDISFSHKGIKCQLNDRGR